MTLVDRIRALITNWEDRATATEQLCPDLKELRPTTQMYVLAKAQRICGQELEKTLDEE